MMFMTTNCWVHLFGLIKKIRLDKMEWFYPVILSSLIVKTLR